MRAADRRTLVSRITNPWMPRLDRNPGRPAGLPGSKNDLGKLLTSIGRTSTGGGLDRRRDFSSGLEPGPVLDYFPYLSPPPAS